MENINDKKYHELDELSKKEYKTIILHLFDNNSSFQLAVEDLVRQAKERGHLKNVKIGHSTLEVY